MEPLPIRTAIAEQVASPEGLRWEMSVSTHAMDIERTFLDDIFYRWSQAKKPAEPSP